MKAISYQVNWAKRKRVYLDELADQSWNHYMSIALINLVLNSFLNFQAVKLLDQFDVLFDIVLRLPQRWAIPLVLVKYWSWIRVVNFGHSFSNKLDVSLDSSSQSDCCGHYYGHSSDSSLQFPWYAWNIWPKSTAYLFPEANCNNDQADIEEVIP